MKNEKPYGYDAPLLAVSEIMEYENVGKFQNGATLSVGLKILPRWKRILKLRKTLPRFYRIHRVKNGICRSLREAIVLSYWVIKY